MTLFLISSALLTWSVNQTLTEENSVLTVFIIVKECGEIFINCPNCLFGTKLNKTFDVCWSSFLTKLQWTKITSTDSNFGTFSLYFSLSAPFLCFLTISLFQESTILICILFLFSKNRIFNPIYINLNWWIFSQSFVFFDDNFKVILHVWNWIRSFG